MKLELGQSFELFQPYPRAEGNSHERKFIVSPNCVLSEIIHAGYIPKYASELLSSKGLDKSPVTLVLGVQDEPGMVRGLCLPEEVRKDLAKYVTDVLTRKTDSSIFPALPSHSVKLLRHPVVNLKKFVLTKDSLCALFKCKRIEGSLLDLFIHSSCSSCD